MRGFAGYTVVPSGDTYGDVAVPNDLVELGIFQGLQRAINTYRDKFKPGMLEFDRLSVDGEIGNLTRIGFNNTAAHARQYAGSTLASYGTNSALAAEAKAAALALGVAGGFTPDFTPDPEGASPRVKDSIADRIEPIRSSSKSKVGLAVAGGLLAGLVWWAASDRR